jgi:hypothetical protein
MSSAICTLILIRKKKKNLAIIFNQTVITLFFLNFKLCMIVRINNIYVLDFNNYVW